MTRGIPDEAKKTVFVEEEEHRADKGWGRPERGATVTKDGVVYSVQSKQPEDLSKASDEIQKGTTRVAEGRGRKATTLAMTNTGQR